jgi:hypothetical protein
MSHFILAHPIVAVLCGAIIASAAWEMVAHLFLVSCGLTGTSSWSWWVQSLAAMLP